MKFENRSNEARQQLPDLKSLRKKAGQSSSRDRKIGTIMETSSEEKESEHADPHVSSKNLPSEDESDDEFLSKLREENKELEKQLYLTNFVSKSSAQSPDANKSVKDTPKRLHDPDSKLAFSDLDVKVSFRTT